MSDSGMNVRLLRGTRNAEELVCTAARNDYRSDGVIDHGFDEIMASIEPDDEHLNGCGNGEPGQIEAKKRTLIDHLMRSGHWGPFEHPQATVAIEGVTRVVTHQIVRHRHFTYDQQSLRYVTVDGNGDSREELEDTFDFPDFIDEGEVVSREGVEEIDSQYVQRYMKAAYSSAAHHYNQLLDEGVPKEKARKVLPMGTKTNIVMSGNARAWMHILKVRTRGDVQGETLECANAIFEELKQWMPYSFEQYEEKLPMELGP